MPKRVAVFAAGSNPAKDSPRFHTTRYDARLRIENYQYRYLNLDAIQEPLTFIKAGAQEFNLFKNVWHKRPSAGFIVWQCRGHKGTGCEAKV